MTTPRNDPLLLFIIVKTTKNLDCFFCSSGIKTQTDVEYYVGMFPGTKTLMEIHPACFEQLAWSMWKFLAHTLTHPENTPLN